MEVYKSEYAKKVKAIYLNDEEELINFLNICKLKGSKVMLCPRCSDMFYTRLLKAMRKLSTNLIWWENGPQSRRNYAFNKRGAPYRI